MMKKFLTLFMSFLLLLSLPSVANAGKAEYYYWIHYRESWEFMDSTLSYRTNNGKPWRTLYVGVPSTGGGHQISVTEWISVEASLGGVVHLPEELLEAEVNVSLSGAVGMEVNATSDFMEEGEYVIIEYREYFEVYTILQALLRDGQGYALNSNGEAYGSILVLNGKVADTENCYVYKPIAPQLKFTYYNTNAAPQAIQQARIEIYTYIDGKYVMTDSYTRLIESTDIY